MKWKNFLTILKDWLSRYNKNKRKTVSRHITHLMSFLLKLLTISSQLASQLQQVPFIFSVFTFFLQSYINHAKRISRKVAESRFGGSEKDRYLLKILKWQHRLIRECKREKLVSFFLNNAVKTCSYGLKNSENMETEYAFQFKAFFHLSGTLHTKETQYSGGTIDLSVRLKFFTGCPSSAYQGE